MFREWIAKFLLSDNKKTGKYKDAVCFDLNVQLYYKRLAINACINLIANGLTTAVFRTYDKGKEVRENNYYLFNVQPNLNQNAAEFMHQLVSDLVMKNEALVFMQDKQLFIADNWTCKEFALRENVYKDIYIKDFKLNKAFMASDVFHFKLNNEPILDVIDGLYHDYGKLIASSMGYYKRGNALRGAMYLDTSGPQTDEEQDQLDDLFNVQFKNFFEAEGGAVLPLYDGQKFEEAFSESGKGNKKDSRDIRAIIDDIFDFVAMAFQIPKGLIKGDLAEVESQRDNFIMFGLNPIAELIKDEINRTFYTKEQYLNRTYLKIDTTMIKYVDPAKIAEALDKLLSSGTHSTNENRSMIGDEPINEDWANEHYITKNYDKAKDYLKGGGKDE